MHGIIPIVVAVIGGQYRLVLIQVPGDTDILPVGRVAIATRKPLLVLITAVEILFLVRVDIKL